MPAHVVERPDDAVPAADDDERLVVHFGEEVGPGRGRVLLPPDDEPVAPEPALALELVDRRVVVGPAGQQRGGPVRAANGRDLLGRERRRGHRRCSWDQPSGTVLRGSRNGIAAVRAGHVPPSGATISQLVAGIGEADRDPDVADVLLEPGRPDQVGHGADRLAARQRVALARELERERVAGDLDADQLAVDARHADLLERRLADVVGVLRLDEPLETHDLERGVVDGHVRAVVEDAGLDPACLARGDRADVVRLAGVHDPVPQVAATRRIAQVDLVADLAGPARPADDDRDAVDLGRQRPVVLDVVDGRAEQRPHDVLRLRALDLDGIDLGLADLDVHPGMRRDPARPQPGVRVGQRQPPSIGLDAQQDRVVDDPAVLGRDEHVLALADGAFRQVATGQHVGEGRRIRAGDLDDPLDRHVPHGHVVEQRPVLLDRVGVIARQVHVVVDVVGAATRGQGLLEERRAPVPRPEVQRRRIGRGRGRGRAGHPGNLTADSGRRRVRGVGCAVVRRSRGRSRARARARPG